MDVVRISANPIDSLASRSTDRQNPIDGGFAAAIAAEADDGRAALERAEGLIGTRVRAPEGGCGCDALIRTVAAAPDARAAVDRAPAVADSVLLGQSGSAQRRLDVSPGGVLLLSSDNELSDHLHRAIMRNASEMITANRNGLVEVLSIPWDRVTQRR